MSSEIPGDALYCDVSLPVPLEQSFTYGMPESFATACNRGAG